MKHGLRAEDPFLLKSPGRQRTRGRPLHECSRARHQERTNVSRGVTDGISGRKPKGEGKASERIPLAFQPPGKCHCRITPSFSSPTLFTSPLFYSSLYSTINQTSKLYFSIEEHEKHVGVVGTHTDRIYKPGGTQFHVERHHGVCHDTLVSLFGSLPPL